MRIDLNKIGSYIAPNSHILDLGCGDGALLAQLQQTKNITGFGLENDPENITACITNGVNVIEHDLNKGLSHIADNSYDVVVMTLAIQAMDRPDTVLDEMLRIGKQCIVTFPNFAHWKARSHLCFHGRMPVSDLLPFEWYDTPNIHFCTIRDFEELCKEKNIYILDRSVINTSSLDDVLAKFHRNLFAETAVYHLSRQQKN